MVASGSTSLVQGPGQFRFLIVLFAFLPHSSDKMSVRGKPGQSGKGRSVAPETTPVAKPEPANAAPKKPLPPQPKAPGTLSFAEMVRKSTEPKKETPPPPPPESKKVEAPLKEKETHQKKKHEQAEPSREKPAEAAPQAEKAERKPASTVAAPHQEKEKPKEDSHIPQVDHNKPDATKDPEVPQPAARTENGTWRISDPPKAVAETSPKKQNPEPKPTPAPLPVLTPFESQKEDVVFLQNLSEYRVTGKFKFHYQDEPPVAISALTGIPSAYPGRVQQPRPVQGEPRPFVPTPNPMNPTQVQPQVWTEQPQYNRPGEWRSAPSAAAYGGWNAGRYTGAFPTQPNSGYPQPYPQKFQGSGLLNSENGRSAEYLRPGAGVPARPWS